MVKIRERHPLEEKGVFDIEGWLARISRERGLDTEGGIDVLRRACHLSYQVESHAIAAQKTPESFYSSFLIGLEMAEILNSLQQSIDTLVAAVLYRAVHDRILTLEKVREEFGDAEVKLIEGVLRMASIESLPSISEDRVLGKAAADQVENIRKMLVAVIDDFRVALVKLAERVCIIRAAKYAPPEKQSRIAREIMNIYAPLAHRLGIGHLKWELEDLAFRYLEPDTYKHIARLLDEKRIDRQDYIARIRVELESELRKAGIIAEISGRAKHIYSIWRKMQAKNIGFSQVYDIRALRVLVPTVHDCYSALGVVHTMWRNIPNEFDDYIANPKENGYRSLHTAVIGAEGKVIEVQIRTFDMHREAEYGVCAHWQYKGSDRKDGAGSYEEKIAWLRHVLEWHEETGGDRELIEELRADITPDKIYVFTPEGHVVDLPRGATALDFAYHIHTGVGHRCRGARVNSRIVPLYHELMTGDQVEVLTGKREAPSRDWLASGLGYVHTSRARSKIHNWFRQQARDQHIESGRILVDREFQRLALGSIDFDALGQILGKQSLDDLYAAVGAGDLSVVAVLNAALQLDRKADTSQLSMFALEDSPALTAPQDVHIVGAGTRRLSIAECCRPAFGDALVGVVQDADSAEVHRLDCENALQIRTEEPHRIIQVQWGIPEKTFPVDFIVQAHDRRGLIRDISEVLDRENVNVLRIESLTDQKTNEVDMSLTVEVASFKVFSRLLEALSQVPNIYLVRRRQ